MCLEKDAPFGLMEARFTEKLWELVQGILHLLEWSRGTGGVLSAPAQGDIPSGSQGDAEQDFSEGREREREITFSHCLCQPFLISSQKDPVALQRGSGKSSFYDKILLWPRIC